MTNKIIMDEAYPLLGSENLINFVRSVPGVPNVSYRVENERVFVFDKLMRLVKEQDLPEDIDAKKDVVAGLLPKAYTSAAEAVRDWKITPVTFAVETHKDGYLIRHKPFDAVIAKLFEDVQSLHHALTILLLGNNVPTDYDKQFAQAKADQVYVVVAGGSDMFTKVDGSTGYYFIHKGQTYLADYDFFVRMADPFFDSASLIAAVPDSVTTTPLFPCEYAHGCALMIQADFDTLGRFDQSWRITCAKAKFVADQVLAKESEWMPVLCHFPVSSLNERYAYTWVPDNEEVKAVQALRAHYPELKELADSALYDLYDSYQSECNFMTEWAFDREHDFLYYLMGRLAIRGEAEGESLVEAGKIVLFFLNAGQQPNDALDRALKYHCLDNELISLLWKRMTICHFLNRGVGHQVGEGEPVMTTSDLLASLRKHSNKIISFNQSPKDFYAGNQHE